MQLAGVLLRKEALRRGAEEVDVEADDASRMTSTRPRLASAQSRLASYQREHAPKLRSAKRASRPGCLRAAPPRGSSQAHIIGVVVSEMTSEISTAAESVTANSRNSRPTCPCMKRSGMNTATSETLIESTVKPTSLRAEQRRLHAVHAGLDVARGVLEDDDRVVDDEAGGHRDRHQAAGC